MHCSAQKVRFALPLEFCLHALLSIAASWQSCSASTTLAILFHSKEVVTLKTTLFH